MFLLVANLAFLRHFSGLGERRGGRERGEKDQVHGRIQEKRTNVFWEGVRFGRRDIHGHFLDLRTTVRVKR